MRLKYSILGLLAISSLVSCKIDKEGDKPAQAATPQQEKIATGKVMVTINAIVPNDDDFQVFYTEDSSLDFNGDHTLVVSVAGRPEAQDIRFALPDDALPTTLRLDLGQNKDQQKMTINNIAINYYEKSLNIKGADFHTYFQQNANLASDGKTAVFTPTVIDGAYDPMAYPSGDLINALKAILVK